MKLWTLGYEGLDLHDFVATLQRHGIQRVVDVREAPISRKKGFSKRPLSEALERAGIIYDLRRELGVIKEVRDSYKTDGDWRPFADWYAAHLQAHGSEVAAVAGHALEVPTCLVCYEADAAACHRSLLARRLAPAGLEVVHLSANDQ